MATIRRGDVGIVLPWARLSRAAVTRRQKAFLLVLPAVALLLLFFILPYLYLLYISVMTQSHNAKYITRFTLANYAQTIGDLFIWRVIFHTLRLGVITTVVALVLSYPLAYHLARASSVMKGFLMMLVLTPLLVGVVIRTYSWMILLSDTGLINSLLTSWGAQPAHLMYNDTGVTIGLVHIYIPFMVLSLAGPLQGIDPDIERAARSLGAGAWQAFWRVTWPLSLPGVVSGSVLVFVLAISSYVIPSLLGGFTVITVPLLAIRTITELFNWPLGSALTIVFFALTVVIVWLFLRLMSRAMKGAA